MILVGAGHAHLHAIKRAAEFARRGLELVVIAPEDFWYSGLATGVLGGRYAPEEDQVDIKALVSAGGGRCRFVRDRVVTIDAAGRGVGLASGASLSYDVLSLNLGSESHPIPGEGENVFAIKPLHHLWRLRQALEKAVATGISPRVVVAGGGASGCEIAANIRALLGEKAGAITVLARGERIGEAFPPAVAGTLMPWLECRGIRVRLRTEVVRIEGNFAVSETGEPLPFDFLVNATGLHAPALLRRTGLPLTARDELLVDEFLRSTGDTRIFGGGDCVAMRGRELAKVGVYAVREAPVLFHNLLAALDDEPLREFRAQRHFLLVLNLGDGIGLAHYRGWHWLGRAAFWLKDRIDRSFVARSRTPVP